MTKKWTGSLGKIYMLTIIGGLIGLWGYSIDLDYVFKILKTLVITCLLIGTLMLAYLIFIFIKYRIENKLLKLIRKNQFNKANKIISQKYDKLNASKKKIYEYYKVLITHKQLVENKNAILVDYDDSIRAINSILNDDSKLPLCLQVNYSFLLAELYLLRYKKSKDEKDIHEFKAVSSVINAFEIADLLSYNNHVIGMCTLAYKAKDITHQVAYLDGIPELVQKLGNMNIRSDLVRLNVESIQSKLCLTLYEMNNDRTKMEQAREHIINSREIIDNLPIYSILKRKWGKLSLYYIQEKYLALDCGYSNLSLEKKHIKLSKKQRESLNRLEAHQNVNQPVVNLVMHRQKKIQLSPIKLLVIALVIITPLLCVFLESFVPATDVYNTSDRSNFSSDINLFLERLYEDPLYEAISQEQGQLIDFKGSIAYLNDKRDITLSWLPLIRENIYLILEMPGVGDTELIRELIEPYVISVMLADDDQLSNDEATRMVRQLMDNIDEGSIEVRGNRVYRLSYENEKIEFNITIGNKY